MNMSVFGRKPFARLLLGLSAFAALAASTLCTAEDKYPSRPIEFIVPWGPGGGADQLARKVGKMMEDSLKTSIPVVNAPGATGSSGMTKMLVGEADGYSMSVFIADTHALLATSNPKWKPEDYKPLAIMLRQPSALFVPTNSHFKTWADFEKEARANPGKLKVAVLGLGSIDDMTLRYLGSKGVKASAIPFANPGERYLSILGGHADALYEQAGDVKQMLDNKQIRPLIFFSAERLAEYPDVPTAKELGYDVMLPQFRSIIVKAGTPPERVKVLADALAQAAGATEYKAFLKDSYADPASYLGPGDADKFLQGELAAMRRLLATIGK
jgi:tripartite-type tricarboxylate transporter receptor subunit TctC